MKQDPGGHLDPLLVEHALRTAELATNQCSEMGSLTDGTIDLDDPEILDEKRTPAGEILITDYAHRLVELLHHSWPGEGRERR